MALPGISGSGPDAGALPASEPRQMVTFKALLVAFPIVLSALALRFLGEPWLWSPY
jgi:hypothetical protein